MPIVAQFPGGGGGDSMKLSGLVMAGNPTKTVYMDGDTFNPAGMTFEASYSLAGVPFTKVDVSDQVVFSPNPLTAGTTEVVATFQDKADKYTKTITGITVNRKLDRIEVTTDPTLEYEHGDTFNTAGMVVEAVYQTGGGTTEERAPISGYSISPANGAALTPTISGSNLSATQTATLSYTENGITKTTTLTITVNRKKIPVPSWKGTLTYNTSSQSADSAALWNNYDTTRMTMGGVKTGTNAVSYNATFTPRDNFCWADDGSITAKTRAWSIERKAITNEPSQSGTLRYTGSSQNPTWNNYSTTELDISGETSGTDAKTYNVTFTPTSNYCWTGGSTTGKAKTWQILKRQLTKPSAPTTTFTYNGAEQGPAVTGFDSNTMTKSGTEKSTNATTTNHVITYNIKDTANNEWAGDGSITAHTISWKINKKTLTITAGTIATIGASNYNTGITVALNGMDAYYSGSIGVTYTGSGVTSAVVEGSGTSRVIRVKGNGSTAGTATITVTFGADSNYNTISNLVFNVTAAYFTWDGVTNTNAYTIPTAAQANSDWWNGLKSWLANSTATERARAVGKKVQVTLSSAVLGTTTHYVRCIGYDCDGANTLTFQTMNCLATAQRFDGTDALWVKANGTDCEARAKCKEYYNAFPGKNAIRSVKKRYCSIQDGSGGHTSDKQYDETCFLISFAEIGYTDNPYSSAMDEFAVENTGNTAYQYFTGNDRRGKYMGTDNDPEGKTSSLTGYPWLRSRFYNYASHVCCVSSNGNRGYNNYGSTSIGVAPAFAIGN